ncbi:MAG: HesA/MoeB/ThiF family protein [Methanobrevibacter olleyae]|uniref:HesA/MoeB/ThiF family protein n=1 Tax=Methanobrevibacter olleyae TaxID=294671 RepID=A0A8T3VMQ1_METOL|nr:HesA/MoeB/ThiF family protein [Methanobrevibacter olleyae]
MPERYKGFGYWDMATRQMGIVTKSQQTRFKEAKIGVVGCGGIGGETILMLARMGLGDLTIIDKDAYDLSNLNRQAISSLETIGVDKSIATKERVRITNPYTKVNAFNEELNADNIEEVFGDRDIIIDALDNLYTRIITSRFARENDIPFVHGAIHGTQGQVSVFTKDTPSYEEFFSLPSLGKELGEETKNEISELTKGVPPVIGPVPNIVGCLEAFEAYKLVTGIGEVNYAPKILNFDLLNLESFKVLEL